MKWPRKRGYEEDTIDAAHELRDMIGGDQDDLYPLHRLFATFDRFWMPWNPADDAARLAADIVNDVEFPGEPEAIAAKYGWQARRLNPALAYLIDRKIVNDSSGIGSGEWVTMWVGKTDATRRFVKSRL